jgi:hypothetical protein
MGAAARHAVLVLAVAAIALAGDDPGGWSKARWGMTEAQILHAFAGEAVRLDPPEQMGLSADQAATLAKLRNNLNEFRTQMGHKPEDVVKPAAPNAVLVRVAVPSFTLARVAFRALLVPDQAGQLDSVLLTPINHADETGTLFETLEQMLVQKYGRPWVTKDGESADVQWTIHTTVITLTRWRGLSDRLCVTILYKRKAADRL